MNGRSRVHTHFGCCVCLEKELPRGVKLPEGFGVVCQDCCVECRRLLRKNEKEAAT